VNDENCHPKKGQLLVKVQKIEYGEQDSEVNGECYEEVVAIGIV
jgi:hypothetical protein